MGAKSTWARAAGVRRSPLDRRSRAEQVAAAVVSNALVGYLLISGRIDPLGLVLLVACEAILLSFVEVIESRFVPAEVREEHLRGSLVGRFALLLLILAALLGFNLLLIVAVLKKGDAVRAFLNAPLATFQVQQILAPLAVTLLGAMVGAARDLARHSDHREHGGPLESTPGRNAGARWLVLVLAVLPQAVPLIGMLAMGLRLLQKRNERSAQGLAEPFGVWHFAAFLILWFGLFFLVARLYSSGLAGWTFFFCVAKVVSDLASAGALGAGNENGQSVPTPANGAEKPAVR